MLNERSFACRTCRHEVAAVTVEQAAELKGVHQRTVYRWIKRKKVHVIMVPGGKLCLCRESLLDRHRSLGDRRDSALNPQVEQVVELIKEQYPNPNLTLEKLGLEVRLSYSHLSRLFKAKTGCGFREFLMDVRMKKAAELLSTTRRSNKEIAHDVGYKHVSDFCRHFKQVHGVTPSEYRKNSTGKAHSVAGDDSESAEREREREKKALPIRSEVRIRGPGRGLMSQNVTDRV